MKKRRKHIVSRTNSDELDTALMAALIITGLWTVGIAMITLIIFLLTR